MNQRNEVNQGRSSWLNTRLTNLTRFSYKKSPQQIFSEFHRLVFLCLHGDIRGRYLESKVSYTRKRAAVFLTHRNAA